MVCKVDSKDYTPEQKRVLEDFHNLIATKIGVPCLVYDPPPSSCSHTECVEAHGFSSDPNAEPPSMEALALMMRNPKSFLSKFSKEELDAIVEAGKDVPEICGNGE